MFQQYDERLAQANRDIVRLKAALYACLREMDKCTMFDANITPFFQAEQELERIDGETQFNERMNRTTTK